MSTIQCAILDDYQGLARSFADWSSLKNVEITTFTDPISPEQLPATLADFEILIAMRERTRFDEATLAKLPKLKLLVTTGMKNSAIDVAAAKARGIAVCGTQSLSYPAPELTWGLLLDLARNIALDANSVRAGEKWQTRIGTCLSGKTLGIIGLGRIGRQIARYGHAFDMKLLAWSRNLTEEQCQAAGAEKAPSLQALLQHSDVVTLHMILSESTRNLIGAPELAVMKPTALLINTSRGPLVNEQALVQALAEKRIGGAALDVFDIEPLPADHPFRSLPNVLATPHTGFVCRENYQVFYGEAVEDIQAWLAGEPQRAL